MNSEFHEDSDNKELYEFFMQAPAPMAILTGPQHRFKSANPPYLRMVGRDVIGKTVLEAFTEQEVGHYVRLLDNVFQTGVPYIGKELALDIANEHGVLENRFLNIGYYAFRNSQNEIKGIFAIHDDVTEQVQARHSVEQARDAVENERANFKNLFRQTPEMVCILSGPEHRFEFVNEAHIRTLGFDATGKTVREAQPESVEIHGLLDRVYSTGETAFLDEIPVTVGTKLRYFDLTFAAKRDARGAIDGVMILGLEVTDAVLSRNYLNDMALHLAQAKEDAERANNYKTEFLANMSHEIRTPLGAMLGFTDLLRDPHLTHGQRNEYINIIAKNGAGLSVIINDILDLSKVEAGHLNLEYTDADLPAILADIQSLLAVKVKEKGLELKVEVAESMPQRIVSDPVRVRQILLNLVSNSIKFTPSGSITIRCFGAANANGKASAYFEITDTGIGIAESQKDKIFDVFVQADDSTTRRFGGTGLGLTLSRILARALGGDIQITRSAPGDGTTILASVSDQPELRVSKEVHQDSASAAISEKSLQGLNVLVVDDSPDNQQLVGLYLRKQGSAFDFAETGVAAVKMALSGNYDVVLMDIQMPEMDGYTATSKLRAAGYKKPIVALSAHAMTEVREKIMRAGANAHLSKPINQHDLVATIMEQVR